MTFTDDFIKDHLGYELADCICGERPELVSILRVNRFSGHIDLDFKVQCPKCGRTSGIFVDEADAVFHWNRYMKKKPEEDL